MAGGALLLSACSDTAGPLRPIVGRDGIGRGGRAGGGAGGGATVTSIVGTWRHLASSPTLVTDTRWRFGNDARCERSVVTTHVDTGVEDTVVRLCSYTLTGSTLTVVFDGSTFQSNFLVAFSDGDLLLDGFRFRRIG